MSSSCGVGCSSSGEIFLKLFSVCKIVKISLGILVFDSCVCVCVWFDQGPSEHNEAGYN